MQGLQSILSLFCNKVDRFNITGAGMLDSLSYEIQITLKSHFGT